MKTKQEKLSVIATHDILDGMYLEKEEEDEEVGSMPEPSVPGDNVNPTSAPNGEDPDGM